MELSINKLSKHYGAKVAVDEISITLKKGVYGLLGSNGSGKTTLMRMLADVLRPTSGNITLDEIDIYTLDEEYRSILGYLPQNFGYYKNLKAIDFFYVLVSTKRYREKFSKKEIGRIIKYCGVRG